MLYRVHGTSTHALPASASAPGLSPSALSHLGGCALLPGGGLHLITHAAPPPGVRETGTGGQRATPTTRPPPGLPLSPGVLGEGARLLLASLFACFFATTTASKSLPLPDRRPSAVDCQLPTPWQQQQRGDHMHFGPAGRRRDLRCLDLRHRQATGSPKRRLLLLLGMQGRENRRKTAVVASLFDGSAYMGYLSGPAALLPPSASQT